eukprot:2455658-Pleurochrysis_carterae.AAC.1
MEPDEQPAAPRPKAPRSEAQKAQFELRKQAVVEKKAAAAKRTLEEKDALALKAVKQAYEALAGPSEAEAPREPSLEPERVKVSGKSQAKEAPSEPKPRKPHRRRVVMVEESSDDGDSDRTEEESRCTCPAPCRSE